MVGRISPEATNQKGRVQTRICMLALVVAGGIAASYLLWQHHTKVAADNAEATILAYERTQMVERLETQLSDRLSDPDSAKFRSLVLYRDPISGMPQDVENGSYALCGEVNAKDLMGGYVGYRRFVSATYISPSEGGQTPTGTSGAFIDNSDEDHIDKGFGLFWEQSCKGQSERIEPQP